jgi:hypothetical protein
MGWPRIENRQDHLDSNTVGLLPPHDHVILPHGALHGLPRMSRPLCKVKDAQVLLMTETLLEIGRVLRADAAVIVPLVLQVNARAVE